MRNCILFIVFFCLIYLILLHSDITIKIQFVSTELNIFLPRNPIESKVDLSFKYALIAFYLCELCRCVCVCIFKNFKCIKINIYMYVRIFMYYPCHKKLCWCLFIFQAALRGGSLTYILTFPISSPTRMLCLTCSVSLAPSLFPCMCLHLIKFCRFLSVIVIVAFFAHFLSLSVHLPSRSLVFIRLAVVRLLW